MESIGRSSRLVRALVVFWRILDPSSFVVCLLRCRRRWDPSLSEFLVRLVEVWEYGHRLRGNHFRRLCIQHRLCHLLVFRMSICRVAPKRHLVFGRFVPSRSQSLQLRCGCQSSICMWIEWIVILWHANWMMMHSSALQLHLKLTRLCSFRLDLVLCYRTELESRSMCW